MAELRKAQEQRYALIKEHDIKMEQERKSIMKEKNDELKGLRAQMETERMYFKRFHKDLENMTIIATEMSSLGIAIENMTSGLTRKYHGWKTRLDLICFSVEKKEKKYREMIGK